MQQPSRNVSTSRIDPATYRANYAALEAAFPELIDDLPMPGTEAALDGSLGEGGASEYECIDARNGSPTLRLRGVMVHSAYDPEREAKRIVDTPDLHDALCIAFYGCGYGYHIAAAAAINPDAQLLVIEPDAELFVLCLRMQNLSRLIASGRVSVALGAGPEAVIALLGSFSSSELAIVRIKALYHCRPDYWDALDQAFMSLARRDETNAATLARFGRRWTKNLIRNLPAPLTAPTVEAFQRAFAGVPVLLAAAGPGLHEVAEHLEALYRRCVLVAVDTALPYLLERGVDPDFVVVVDPQYWNSRHLDYCGASNSVVITESSTYPRSLRLLSGVKAFAGSLFPLGKYLEERVAPRSKLGAGGSVATSAWDFAKQIGASTVYCAGLDLGFPGYQTHVPGSLYERYFRLRASRTLPMETGQFSFFYSGQVTYKKSASGRAVPTDARMAVYVFWFQMQLAAGDAPPTFTLSENSLAVPGMRYVSPPELDDLPDRRDEINRTVSSLRAQVRAQVRAKAKDTPKAAKPTKAPTAKEATRDRAGSIFQALYSAKRALERIGGLARDGLRLVGVAEDIAAGRHVSTAPELDSGAAFGGEPGNKTADMHAILTALDRVDTQIARDETRHIAAFLASAAIHDVASPSASQDGTADTTKVLARSRQLYQALVSSVEDHLILLAHALDAHTLDDRQREQRSAHGYIPSKPEI